MNFSLIHITIYKKNLKKLAFLLLGIAVFYAAVCTPLYHVTNSDILFRDGIASLIVDYVRDIANYLFYWIMFAFLLYVGVTLGQTTLFKPYLLVMGAVVIVRYLASLMGGYFVIGIPTKWDIWREDLLYMCFDILFDFIQIAVAFWIIYKRVPKMTCNPRFVPIVKLNDSKNSVAATAGFLALIPSVIHLITRVIYDIWEGYIPRDGGDLLWMILGYLSEIIGFVAGYFVIILIINHLYMQAKKTEMIYEAEKGSILRPLNKTK